MRQMNRHDQERFIRFLEEERAFVAGRMCHVPPIVSANDMWSGQNFKGRRIKTPAYKAWLEDASQYMAVTIRYITLRTETPLRVSIAVPVPMKYLLFEAKIKKDIDNCIKPVFDALKESGSVEDDNVRILASVEAFAVFTDLDVWPVVCVAPAKVLIFE